MNSSCFTSTNPRTTYYMTEDADIPPIPSLFKTNNPPAASDVSAIHGEISIAESSLFDLNHQIGLATAILDDLRLKQTQEEQRLKMLKGVLHPIRRIPPELLAAIFSLTLPHHWVESSSVYYRSYNYRKAVLLPGQICGFWRDISLTTPQIWSKITLNLTEKTYQSEINLVNTWLSRAGEQPLFIQIFHPNPANTRGISNPVIPSTLVASCSRWSYLLLVGSQYWLQGGALDGVRNRLSILKSLTDNSAAVGNTDLFENTPQLRNYRFHHKPFISPSSQCWIRLTDLSVNNSTTGQCYEILSQAQNLLTCSFHIIFETPDLPLSQLCHPHLCSLSVVHGSNYYNYDTILDYLTLPALSTLQYTEAIPSNIARTRSSVAAFLSRSKCFLNRLDLQLGAVADGDMLKILQLLPSLSELRLSGIATHELLGQLTYDPLDTNPVVPALHTLELTDSSQKSIPLLADMIESRMPQLKHVWMVLDRTVMPPDATYMRLQKLYDEGLDIRVGKRL